MPMKELGSEKASGLNDVWRAGVGSGLDAGMEQVFHSNQEPVPIWLRHMKWEGAR